MPIARANIGPLAMATLGIALFSAMDAAMKVSSLAIGAYNAMLWRNAIGIVIAFGPYALIGRSLPSRAGLRVHVLRGFCAAIMSVTFFYGIARVPLAEGIALSFIAPLIALYLAAIVLHEKIRKSSVFGSMLGVVGVAILLVARIASGGGHRDLEGVAAVLISSVFYAWNIILLRQQSLLAPPVEVAFFQNLTSGFFLLLAAPFLAVVPAVSDVPMLGLSAILAMCSLMLLAWAYARAQAQVLVPVEYTAFVWAAILGAIMFHEEVTLATIAGTAVIVAGCVIAARGGQPETAKLEAMA